ncbi:MAG: glycosyltransferase family 8 protein [Firmicutes bacterium]|nr:glycosyltransferase family 8 protein [Bacillota bacterium]
MNLLFAINKNFIDLFLNCIKSVVKNGGYDRYICYILNSDFDNEDKRRIKEGVPENVKCHFIMVEEDFFKGFPETKRYPRQIYYRLLAPKLLPDNLDRILYLDVDLVVINPLNELYETDFEGNYFVATSNIKKVLTKVNQLRLGIDAQKDVTYTNTGVLLYNLPVLRKKVKLEDIRDYTNNKGRVFILPDQDILTALYGDRVKRVDNLIYNLNDRTIAFNNADPRKEKINLDWVRKNAVIIHYFGKNKPWKDNYMGILDVFYKEIADIR